MEDPAGVKGDIRQGDVFISSPSPLTGARQLYVVVSSGQYNAAGLPTLLVAEIETGTRYRASAYATETDYGVVLADRLAYYPQDMIGERFGCLTAQQCDQVRRQVHAVID